MPVTEVVITTFVNARGLYIPAVMWYNFYFVKPIIRALK